ILLPDRHKGSIEKTKTYLICEGKHPAICCRAHISSPVSIALIKERQIHSVAGPPTQTDGPCIVASDKWRTKIGKITRTVENRTIELESVVAVVCRCVKQHSSGRSKPQPLCTIG